MKIGSLFTGYSGLDMAVESVTGGRTVWRSDIDPGACKVIAHHWPDTPNLCDITAVDWSAVEPVDIITGGSPCQDLSHAGRREGMREGTRSNLWVAMREAIAVIRPSLVVWENVRGAYSAAAHSDVEPCAGCVGDQPGVHLRALGRVLGDLASVGYDAAWHGISASDVGAPHGRFRVFIVAWPAADPDDPARDREWARTESWGRGENSAQDPDCTAVGQRRLAASGQASGGRAWADTGGPGGAHLANADRSGSQGPQPTQGRDLPHGRTAADATRDGWHEGWPEPEGVIGRPDATQRGGAATADPVGMQPERWGDRRDMGGAEAGHEGAGGQRERLRDAAVDSGAASADAFGGGRVGWPHDPIREPVERVAAAGSGASDIAWGQFEPAIRRWERLTRPAPAPTETSPRGSQRLSPRFVEWMMGLPEGHVTDVPGLSRNEQLKALGNGVVPQQAATALRVLLNAMAVAA